MKYKNFLSFLSVVICISLICSGCLFKKTPESLDEKNTVQTATANKNVHSKKEEIKKFDLYSETPYELPLLSIVEISKLPQNVKKVVDEILEQSQGFYYLRKSKDKVLIILQNPVKLTDTYSRHDLQYAEIDMEGKVVYHSAGYCGIDGETDNAVKVKQDVWLFDETTEPFRPIKHIVYNEKGKVKFTECWNYDEKEPIKYQMKNGSKKVLSLLKESQSGDSNYRKEHIFYDNDGNTIMSLTINYEGANISRINYYNSHDLIDSAIIITEYSDGLKIKEQIYNEDYELEQTLTSEYIDGVRKNIKVFDVEDKQIDEIKN